MWVCMQDAFLQVVLLYETVQTYKTYKKNPHTYHPI